MAGKCSCLLGAAKSVDYFGKRQHLIYYRYIDFMIRGLAADAKSILDVGGSDARYLENYDWFERRVSIDMKRTYESDKVETIVCNFFDYQPGAKFDFVTCLQVLEHVPEAKRFARKLLTMLDNVLISVPYKWAPNSEPDHVHDPVTLWKIRWWFGRMESYRLIVEEPLAFKKQKRLICLFSKKPPNLGRARKTVMEQIAAQAIAAIAAE